MHVVNDNMHVVNDNMHVARDTMLKNLLTVALLDDDYMACDSCYVTKCYVTIELNLRLHRDKRKQMSVRMIYKCTLNVCTNQDVARNQQEHESNLDEYSLNKVT